jgi:hypothetical protein
LGITFLGVDATSEVEEMNSGSKHKGTGRLALVLAIIALVMAAATVGAAQAANACTRYAGYPRGQWSSTTCGSQTGWDTITASGGGFSTSGVAPRDTDYMNASSSVCSPLHLNVWFYNPSTGQTWGSKSLGCVTGWMWSGSSCDTYAECNLYPDSGATGSISGECHTTWTQ